MALKILISGTIGDAEQSLKNRDRSGRPISRDGVYHANTTGDITAILAANPNEKDVYIDIDSPGGGVYDGFGMYDELRTSGRNIHANVINGCHSIAVVLLLSAPLARRTANPNARSLIHLVRMESYGASTGAEMKQAAETLRTDENRMIQIYTERTKLTDAQARQLIQAEKIHTAEDLLRLGFISKINQYKSNTFINQKNRAMTKHRNEGASLLERIGGFLTNAAKVLSPSNFNYEDAEGNVLFSTASETDDLAVGMEVAFPDDTTGGTFELPGGRVVTIEEFVVTAIDEASSEDVEALRTENEALKAQLAEAVNLVEEMKGQIGSTYTPQNRVSRPSTVTRTVKQAAALSKDKDAIKNEIKDSHSKGFGFRGITAPRK